MSWWAFRPRKKKKLVHIPLTPCKHPPDPSPPPPHTRENPPPPGIFNKKSSSPFSAPRGLPLPPSRAEKNRKYPKRPPRCKRALKPLPSQFPSESPLKLLYEGYGYIYIYIEVGVKGVAGRDAIVHKRRRNSSQKATQ